MEYSDLWILFRFKKALDLPRLLQSRHFFLRDDPQLATESSGCRGMTTKMLGKPRIKIDRGADIVATCRSLKDVNPSHKRICQRGESNSRPRAYESPALPLSYPGIKLSVFAKSPKSDQPRKLSGLLYR